MINTWRIPVGVNFPRWREGGPEGRGEWVVYHTGTGETLRLSEAAMAVLETLLERGPCDQTQLLHCLQQRLAEPLAEAELTRALEALLAVLLRHACIERNHAPESACAE